MSTAGIADRDHLNFYFFLTLCSRLPIASHAADFLTRKDYHETILLFRTTVRGLNVLAKSGSILLSFNHPQNPSRCMGNLPMVLAR